MLELAAFFPSYQKKRGQMSKAMPLELVPLYKGKDHRGVGAGEGKAQDWS